MTGLCGVLLGRGVVCLEAFNHWQPAVVEGAPHLE
jgi:hypothetical protein